MNVVTLILDWVMAAEEIPALMDNFLISYIQRLGFWSEWRIRGLTQIRPSREKKNLIRILPSFDLIKSIIS